ncbi:MAG: hypothetical protein R3255_10795 [Candidatus Lokiarchaeia archaeon]|nr:hypothetical protein [Candidatus Lokiarchaeia archaeon]
MEDNQQKLIESNYSKNDPAVKTEAKALILLEFHAKKNVDQTISNPEKYVSWYQYNSKNIDKYLQLCPHCKKPTLSAFDRSVIDSAIDYLNGKRMFTNFPRSEGKFLGGALFMLAFGTILYFIFNYI